MKLAAAVARSLQADPQAELRAIERAVAAGTREAGRGLKAELRRQVGSAGLGQRLARTWRDKHYPNRRLDATSLVYAKAPRIIRAFDEGALIKGVAVDCAGLIVGVGRELGLVALDTRAYGRVPDGQRLRALCDQHLAPKPVAEIAPGDVLLLRFTRHPQHLALAGDRGTPFSLIHAHAEAGRCVEHGADAKWLRRLVAAYSFKQPD